MATKIVFKTIEKIKKFVGFWFLCKICVLARIIRDVIHIVKNTRAIDIISVEAIVFI